MLNSVAAQIPEKEYQREVFQRLAAQEGLATFGEYIYSWWHAYEMHHLIAFYLEQVEKFLETDGEEGIENLLILTPPQKGKSELVSKLFPAWALGKLPDLRVLMGSYGADLVSDHSRTVRNIVLSAEYQAVFGKRSSLAEPVQLSSDSRAVSAWDLAAPHRGGMIAAGVGGAFTGRAKGLFIGDDLFKDHRQAESQDYRDDVWDWFKSSVRPRAKAKVIIMTHWHPDDIAGRAMKQMVSDPNADQWVIVMLPELALEPGEYARDVTEQRKRMAEGVYLPLRDPLERQPGEVLCAAMLSTTDVMKTKATLQDFFFSALYQQMPYAKEGQKYKRDWFKVITKLPDDVKILFKVRYWDKANSSSGDYTAGVLMGYGSDGNFYILDVARGRWTSYERDQKMKAVTEKDLLTYGKVYTWHQQDPGSAGKDSAEATNRLLKGFPVKFETVSGDKAARSEPLESAMQGALVLLLKAAWNDEFIEECVAFDRGAHDDQVDAAASSYTKLLQMIGKPQKEVRSYQG